MRVIITATGREADGGVAFTVDDEGRREYCAGDLAGLLAMIYSLSLGSCIGRFYDGDLYLLFEPAADVDEGGGDSAG